MSFVVPVRRFSSRCLYYRQPCTTQIQHVQRRTAFFGDRKGKTDDATSKPNPVLEEFKRKHGNRFSVQDPTQQAASQQAPKPGDISTSSVFGDEDATPSPRQQQPTVQQPVEVGGRERNPEQVSRVLNPDPNPRERWERKKVIQLIRNNGRLTKPEILKRTERQHLARSYEMKTSTKKLGMLARQIAGKSLHEAITQMRFSRKRVAQEVLKHLEYARDEAIVTRGMGLGLAKMPALPSPPGSILSSIAPSAITPARRPVPQTTSAPPPSIAESEEDDTHLPVQIQLKHSNTRYTVTDPSKIYIDQAWVGRGPYGTDMDPRARGRINRLRTPYTTLTVLLKEETTRVREYTEREEKRRKQRLESVWQPLPDRVIYGQRQWYCW